MANGEHKSKLGGNTEKDGYTSRNQNRPSRAQPSYFLVR